MGHLVRNRMLPEGKRHGSDLPSWLACALVLAALVGAGCKHLQSANLAPLDNAGMRYTAIKDLRQLDVTEAEVAQLVKVKQVGVSDDSAVELVRIAHGRSKPFASADAIASLRRVGISEDTVLDLARLDQLGLWVGEVQAIRLAGISEPVILELGRRHAAGKATLSGPSLAQMKNVGLGDGALLELVRRGVTDAETRNIIALRRRGWGEQQIVNHYTPR